MLTFPFGMPITPVRQADTSPKRIFVLGVYASAVHACWAADDGKTIINQYANIRLLPTQYKRRSFTDL